MRLRHVVAILVAGAFAFSVHLGASQYGGGATKAKPAAAAKEKVAKAGGVQTLTGCLAKGSEPNTYMLNSIEGNGPKMAELINVPATLKLDPHIGHKVAITGTRVAGANAAARTEAGGKKPTAAQRKAEASEYHVAPTALKMISTSCM
jgi:hypothetical protein